MTETTTKPAFRSVACCSPPQGRWRRSRRTVKRRSSFLQRHVQGTGATLVPGGPASSMNKLSSMEVGCYRLTI